MTALRVSLILLLGMSVVACQKELDFEDIVVPPEAGTDGDILVRVTGTSGSSGKYFSSYGYDAANRLILIQDTSNLSGPEVINELKINRDANGIVLNTIEKNNMIAAQGIDSILTRVYYDQATQRYTSIAYDIDAFGLGFSSTDSFAFVYNGNGLVVESKYYLTSSVILGSPDPLYMSSDFYEYSAGGISKASYFAGDPFGGGPPVLVTATTYTYDTKKSALILPNSEAFAIQRTHFSALSNALTINQNTPSDPVPDYKVVSSYTYNSFNRPATTTFTQTPGAVSKGTYYYK